MILSSYPEYQNFQFAPNNHCGFFFLHALPSTIALRLKPGSILSILINIVLKYNLYLWSRNVQFRLLPMTLTSKCLPENDIKKLMP